MACAACTTDRPPPFARRVHSLVLTFPFGVPSSVPPSDLFQGRLPYLVFFPLRDITGAVHQHGSTRSPAMFRPQAFSASRRLAPTTGFVGLFHPTTASRVIPFRGFSRSAASLTHRQFVPSWRCDLSAHRRPKPPAATSRSLTFRVLLCGPKRSSGSVFSLPFSRSPLRLHPPPGFRHSTVNPIPRAIRS